MSRKINQSSSHYVESFVAWRLKYATIESIAKKGEYACPHRLEKSFMNFARLPQAAQEIAWHYFKVKMLECSDFREQMINEYESARGMVEFMREHGCEMKSRTFLRFCREHWPKRTKDAVKKRKANDTAKRSAEYRSDLRGVCVPHWVFTRAWV